jgi:tRNA ligase
MEQNPIVEPKVSTDLAKDAVGMTIPYKAQNPQEITALLRELEDATNTKKKNGFNVKKTKFDIAGSRDGIRVDSWRMQEFDYKKKNLPTYARGLFTIRNKNRSEIAIRGYDKFINVNEVPETKWDNIFTHTEGPYELTLKENGCIIFVSGLEDDTLLVCSKHSTGDRGDIELSHASAGEQRLERQLERLGKTKADLARELKERNVTAVAELCDDTFEEHILAYGPETAGLYLHGMNLNLPEFMTYPGPLVQQFAEDWGFVKTGLFVMKKAQDVRAFLEQAAETGAHDGRDIEGFVIRCKMSPEPGREPYADWFFKYKFEEPYLMYRQWRECTKSLISGKQPRFKKHQKITEEYLLYARKRLAADRSLGKLYNQNHGIIALRNDFLEFKQLKGSDAANLEALYAPGVQTEVSKDIILVPIATIGCGKTTLAIALTELFGWGHVQNDNITGPRRPPRFTKFVLDELDQHPAVVADRNNAQRHERKQLITDVKMQHSQARLVALHFVHDEMDEVRRVAQGRVFRRGDNHQTIHAASDMNKVRGIMDGFISRFEPCDPEREPDVGFDAVINISPTAGSRVNLEVIVKEKRPAAPAQPTKKKPLEYMSVDVPSRIIVDAIEKTFSPTTPEVSSFYKELQNMRRVQPRFHVTLMHRASAKEHPQLWSRYVQHCENEGPKSADGHLGEIEVKLERVVWDQRLMAVVVRLVEPKEDTGASGVEAEATSSPKWECVNKVAHITVGTREDSVKPKESNDLLTRWLEQGNQEGSGIHDLVVQGNPSVTGVVRGVLSR